MTSNSDPNQKTPIETSTPSTTDESYTPYIADEVKSKPNWLWLLPLLLVTLVIGLFAGRMWGEKQPGDDALNTERSVSPQVGTATGVTEIEKKVNQKPVLTVETVTSTQSSVTKDLTADGTISPETTSSVSGKVNGVAIDRVLVKEGDQVKRGQVLAIFDTDAMQQQLIQARAELAEAESSYDLAKRDAERVLPLLKINAISQQEADRYVATANQASASVAASRARLNNQNLNMQNAKVTAPVSGVISEKTANVGSVPGPEPLFTIIEEGKLEWQAQVDPNKVGQINVGTPVEVPAAPPHVAGLFALRSRVFTLIDPHVVIGLPPVLVAPGQRVIVVDVAEHGYALLADEIEDVCFIDAAETRLAGKLMPGWARVAEAMIEHEGASLLVVDPSHFIVPPALKAA